MLASSAEIGLTTLAVIRNGLGNRIRDLSEERFLSDANDRITLLLTTYCGYREEKNTSMLVTECLALVAQKFGHLSLGEIDEAFRLNACGTIKGNAIAYGGIATVIGFGDVLSHYNEYRKKAVALIQADLLSSSTKAKEAIEDEKRKADYIQMVKDWFASQKEKMTVRYFTEIPHYYCDTLEELGLISFEPLEKQAHMKAAMMYIKAEKEKKAHDDRKIRDDYVRLKTMIENGFTGLSERKDIKTECVMAAKSMAVFEKLKNLHS